MIFQVTVVRAGYGGAVAFWMAHLYPKLIEKVVFVASGTHMTPTLLPSFHISKLVPRAS